MLTLKKLDSGLSSFEMTLAGVLLLVMSVIAFLQVITRYCFFYSLVWSEEVTRYCMILMTFMGAAYAVSKQDHICIDLLSEFFIKHHIPIARLLNLIVFIFLVLCVAYGSALTLSTWEADQRTPAIGFPMFIVYALVVFSLILAAFHAFVRIVSYQKSKEAE